MTSAEMAAHVLLSLEGEGLKVLDNLLPHELSQDGASAERASRRRGEKERLGVFIADLQRLACRAYPDFLAAVPDHARIAPTMMTAASELVMLRVARGDKLASLTTTKGRSARWASRAAHCFRCFRCGGLGHIARSCPAPALLDTVHQQLPVNTVCQQLPVDTVRQQPTVDNIRQQPPLN